MLGSVHSAITQAVLKQPSRRDVIITIQMRTPGTERASTFLKGKLEFKPRQPDCSAQVLTPSTGLPGTTGGAEFVVFQFHGIMSQLGRDLWGYVVQTLTFTDEETRWHVPGDQPGLTQDRPQSRSPASQSLARAFQHCLCSMSLPNHSGVGTPRTVAGLALWP